MLLFARASRGQRVNILVVEDDESLRRTITVALRSCGHEVFGAETGAEALARVASNPPHLIVLDLQLPVVDGWEFVRIIHAQPSTADIPVLVMSAERGISARQLGVQAFLAKPFDLDDLLETAELLLNGVGTHACDAIQLPRTP
jgi:two-component system response regulator AtoC